MGRVSVSSPEEDGKGEGRPGSLAGGPKARYLQLGGRGGEDPALLEACSVR